MFSLSGRVAAGVDETLQDVLDRRLKEAVRQQQERQHADQMAIERQRLSMDEADRASLRAAQSRTIDLNELKHADEMRQVQTDRNVGLDAANVLTMPGMSKEDQATELMQSALRNPNSAATPGMMKVIEGLTKVPPKATLHSVTVPGPNGPITKGVTDEEFQKGVPTYEKPKDPKETPLITIQTVDSDGNPITRIVPKVAGGEYLKPANATIANRTASARVVNEIGTDMIRKLSDPAFQAVLGPALGRAGTLRDFIGNPPPEFSELAGQIESYALANMGVHGMRSTQGADQIKKLLDQHHTPQSMAATIKGLNEFSTRFVNENMPKSGATTPKSEPAVETQKTPTPAKPSAADLIKKYGGGD